MNRHAAEALRGLPCEEQPRHQGARGEGRPDKSRERRRQNGTSTLHRAIGAAAVARAWMRVARALPRPFA